MEASLRFLSLLTLALVLAFSVVCASASEYGFTTELVHRESPRSPYYNPADTPHQRMVNAIRRSVSRANHISLKAAGRPGTPSGVIVSSSGEYLMNLTLGKPAVTIVAIADTGSDLVWTQCEPCTSCFDQVAPLFDPRKSSTYKDVSCSASRCMAIDQTSCNQRNLCEYSYSYGDQSFTNGNIATETFAIGSTSGTPVKFSNFLFGCGHENGGTFDNRTSGIIGLGGGAASLITQMGKTTGGKFSYCLVPFYSKRGLSSKLNFGANAIVDGAGAVSTPLVPKAEKTFYYLTLEAVSVGKTRIEFSSSGDGSSDEGNIIIDSGTTLTLIPSDFYDEIEAAMVKQVKLRRVSDPSGFLSLCYQVNTDADLRFPTVTFHFKGADVALGASNSFVQIDEGIVCFTLVPGQMAIYGNLAQMNYLVGYDIQHGKLSFKPVDCTKN